VREGLRRLRPDPGAECELLVQVETVSLQQGQLPEPAVQRFPPFLRFLRMTDQLVHMYDLLADAKLEMGDLLIQFRDLLLQVTLRERRHGGVLRPRSVTNNSRHGDTVPRSRAVMLFPLPFAAAGATLYEGVLGSVGRLERAGVTVLNGAFDHTVGAPGKRKVGGVVMFLKAADPGAVERPCLLLDPLEFDASLRRSFSNRQ
jgi:hypothetical protein